MLPVSIFFGGVRVFFLCLMSNVTRVYLFWWGPCLLSVSCSRTPPKKIVMGNIGQKTQKEDTTPPKKIDTENIGHKTQKEDTHSTKKYRYG
jgi:hypothetical protein